MRKLALITGATDGIGKATLWRFAQEGWAVVAVGRSEDKLAAVSRELRQQVPGVAVETLQADLGIMQEVAAVCDQFLETHKTLDFLFLNANTITQERRVSSEGFEANLAVGHLGRALMAWKLESVLAATPESQILCTVGLNLERIDFEDLTMGKNFRGMVALGRWHLHAGVGQDEYFEYRTGRDADCNLGLDGFHCHAEEEGRRARVRCSVGGQRTRYQGPLLSHRARQGCSYAGPGDGRRRQALVGDQGAIGTNSHELSNVKAQR